MVRQCLSNINKSATLSNFKKNLHLSKALVRLAELVGLSTFLPIFNVSCMCRKFKCDEESDSKIYPIGQ